MEWLQIQKGFDLFLEDEEGRAHGATATQDAEDASEDTGNAKSAATDEGRRAEGEDANDEKDQAVQREASGERDIGKVDLKEVKNEGRDKEDDDDEGQNPSGEQSTDRIIGEDQFVSDGAAPKGPDAAEISRGEPEFAQEHEEVEGSHQ